MFTICIADDEEYIIAGICKRIEQTGLDIKIAGVAHNGIEAYQLYERVKPDIYLVDINMPLCKGVDFIEKVRNMDKSSITRFIIISGYDDYIYMKKAIQNQVVDYILKPIQQQEFANILEQACGQILELKQKQEKEKKENWLSFDAVLNRSEKFSGTLILVWGENILSMYRDGNQSEQEKLKNIFPPMEWKYLFFYNNTNLFLLAEKERVFTKSQIHGKCERFIENSGVCVVYQSGKDMHLGETLDKMGKTMNIRFWKNSSCILEMKENSEKEKIFLQEKLGLAIENIKEDKWKEELEKEVNAIFSERKNYMLLNSFYRAVIVLVANKYVSHKFEVPGNLEREFLPFAIHNCIDKTDVQERLTEYVGGIHKEIIHEAEKGDLSEQVIDYLKRHYAEDISLAQIAEEFFVVPNYLSKRFKEKTNTTIMQYLEDYRMGKAEELLNSTDMNITAIAHSVGYNDGNYFSRIFRKRNGITPREYRNRS